MAQEKDRNVLITADTAVERLQLFLAKHAEWKHPDAITSHRDYVSIPGTRGRTVYRYMLTASDIQEVLDMLTARE